MNELFVKRLKPAKRATLAEVANLLEQQTKTTYIRTINWQEFGYCPLVKFRIGHIDNEIWLKFDVEEKHILAKEINANGEVYKDSCVEFFISWDGINYYNIEVNCIGIVRLGYGTGRNNRQFVDPEMIKKIGVQSSLGNQPFSERTGNFEWNLMLRIPVECFTFNSIKSLSGKKATANFYKCGDETSEPHFVTWNPVNTPQPDYHQPEFFGKLEFE